MKKFRPFSPYILISLVFFGKLILFSSYLADALSISSIIVSWLIFVAVALLVLPLKKGRKILFIFYAFCSSLMLADAVYFKYYNHLVTIDVVKLIGLLPAVSESVADLLEFKHLLFILDLFIIPKISFVDSEISFNRWSRINVITSSVLLLFIISLTSPGLEFFRFHYNDLTQGFRQNDITVNAQEFLDIKPLTTNEFTGIADGRNLIVVQVEAMQNFVIGRKYNSQEITPFLNNLISDDSIYFDHYFQQLGRGNTSDAEFVSNNSLYPAMDGPTYQIYAGNNYYGLPWILREQGYSTAAFHGYEGTFWNRSGAYPGQGFQWFYSKDDFTSEETIGLGMSDEEFFKQCVDFMKELPQPFYSFLVTLSSHHPFNLPEKFQEIELLPEDENTLLGNYYNAMRYVDNSLKSFFNKLADAGLYENSLICIYGDHHGIILGEAGAKEILSRELGFEYTYDQMMRIPLIVHLPGSDLELKVSKTGGQIDFLPTVLNLFSLQNNKSIMFGRDLLGPEKGFVAQQTYLLKGSFIDDNILFEMSRDGQFENSKAWNIHSREAVPLEQCIAGYQRALQEIELSDYLLKNNLILPEKE